MVNSAIHHPGARLSKLGLLQPTQVIFFVPAVSKAGLVENFPQSFIKNPRPIQL
jgi:hypothetical protein